MLPCQNCGFDNELGRIFCHQCGTKLDLTQIKAPGHGGKKIRRKGQWSVRRLIKWVVDLVLLALLVWGIYLLCQVPVVRTIQHTERDRDSANNKKFELEQHINQKKPIQITFSEVEMNAMVRSFHFTKPEGTGIRIEPTTLQVELGEGVVTSIFVGKLSIGSFVKEISIRYTCAPIMEGGVMEFKPISAAFGSLPIHPQILKSTGVVQGQFKSLYGSLTNEQRLLDQLTSIAIHAGQADLVYQPAAPAR